MLEIFHHIDVAIAALLLCLRFSKKHSLRCGKKALDRTSSQSEPLRILLFERFGSLPSSRPISSAHLGDPAVLKLGLLLKHEYSLDGTLQVPRLHLRGSDAWLCIALDKVFGENR